MINIRSENEIIKLRSAGKIAAAAMEIARDGIKPGITTLEISNKVRSFIESKGAIAAFLGYNDYPGAICISVNEEVVHGIPGDRVLEDGDIVKLDVGTYIHGYYGDMARTYPVGKISGETKALITATEESLYLGIKAAVSGNHLGDIGHAVQSYVENKGYSVVRKLVGHGIGRNLHEEPQVPNFGQPGSGSVLKSGMVLAIEPMVNAGMFEVSTLEDEWTVVTKDGELSSHFENTCVVREGFPEILTLMNGEEKWQKTIQ
ncbi:type I methionyl aminopeptidase [Candidatus Latescibacterota bacterium]